MDNFNDQMLKQSRQAAPEGMYNQVRERIVSERLRMAKTRRQLAVGSALLLIVGIVNVVIILFYSNQKPPVSSNSTEKILYETYFENQISLY